MESASENGAISRDVSSEDTPVSVDHNPAVSSDDNGNVDDADADLDSSSPRIEESSRPQQQRSSSEHESDVPAANGEEESTDSSEDVSAVDHSELIREASEAAVAEAVAMKRSDSDLSEDQLNDDGVFEEGLEDAILQAGKDSKGRSLSIAYQEDFSFEAEMMSDHHHRLQPSGRLGRLRGSSSKEIIDVVDSLGDSISNVDDVFDNGEEQESGTDVRRASQRHFQSMSRSSLPTIHATETLTSTDGDGINSCNEDEDENQDSLSRIETFELSSLVQELAMDIPVSATEGEDPSLHLSEEASILSGLFLGFCRPSIPSKAFEEIIQLEQGKRPESQVDLPLGSVVSRLSSSLLELLNNQHGSFLLLPKVVALSVCRILTRVLTGATDTEYDFCVMTYCPWHDELYSPIFDAESDLRGHERMFQTSSLQRLYPGSDESTMADLIHSVVRLRMQWQNALKQVLDLLESILESDSKREYLVAPVTFLLGVLCASSVAPKELRRMVGLASGQRIRSCTLKAQLMMVRALGIAASSTSKPAVLVGSSNPLQFFSFLSGPGITRAISLEKSSWPFRNDFGVAFSFRAEDFVEASASVVLFSAMGDNGNGIEISLASLPKEEKDHASAGMLCISVMEKSKPVQKFQVTKCPLHARVWYHVAVRHTRSRLKGVFSLSAKEQLTVMVDRKIMLSDSVHFPQIHEDCSSKSLSFTYGKNLDGQTGALYVFHENVSDSLLKSMASHTSETRNGGLSRQSSKQVEVDSSHKELVSRVMSLSKIGSDDLQDMAFCQRSMNDAVTPLVSDGKTRNDIIDGMNEVGKGLYLVWDPRKASGSDFIVDTHSGAHTSLVESNLAKLWNVQGAQNVISSIGGVQLLVLIVHSLLERNDLHPGIDVSVYENKALADSAACFSLVPDILYLLSAFIRMNQQNCRELLRCGAVEVLEGLLLEYSSKDTGSCLTFYSALSVFPSLAELLVGRLMELRANSREFLGLEAAVLSRLLFNVRLWLGELPNGGGVVLARVLVPRIGEMLDEHRDACDFVPFADVILLVEDLAVMENDDRVEVDQEVLWREPSSLQSLMSCIKVEERDHLIDTLLYWVLLVFRAGAGVDDFTTFLSILSKNLDLQFEETSKSIAEGPEHSSDLPFTSKQRNSLTTKLCEVLLFSFQTQPAPSRLFENFSAACGGYQQGAGWILSSMINCHSDQIRGIGIQCLVAFVRTVSTKADQPFETPAQPNEVNHRTTFQENTMILMNSVGNGIMSSNVGKGIAAMAPGVRSKLSSPTMLTPRVIYKLLWHLVKSHRYRMEQFTQAGLVSMVFNKGQDANLQQDELVWHHKINFERAESEIAEAIVTHEGSVIDDVLGLSTLFRLLRFLPDEYLNQWLLDLVDLSKNSFDARTTLSSCPDWQACLFQLVSESIEKFATRSQPAGQVSEEAGSQASQILDNCLDFYALLLGRLVRIGGDTSIAALQECAALQRVFVNGPEAFALVLSHLLDNLFEYGITLAEINGDSGCIERNAREPIQVTAQQITNEILSNGAPSAVASWRVLRYLTTVVVAFATTVETPPNALGFWIDIFSGGLCGVFLPENGVGRFCAQNVVRAYGQSESSDISIDFRLRICLNVVEQLLAILDVFIFPASASSQLHGLALVRCAETRDGNAQGPLLASLVRASLFLLRLLDPSSLQMLQSCGRLLCLCHYSLELLRESQALEGYTSSFSNLTAPLDQALMAVVVQAHATLQRCAVVLNAIESSTLDAIFSDKETRKKRHRRLFKVCIELREILATLAERRSTLLQELMTKETYVAFQSSMESKAETSQPTDVKKVLSEKELIVRRLLSSEWISKFGTSSKKGAADDQSQSRLTVQKKSFIDITSRDSTRIEAAFQKSLNGSFEYYLEKQRKWAESSAVRDLEFEGDTIMKEFVNKCDSYRLASAKSGLVTAAQLRLKLVNHIMGNVWQPSSHWMMEEHADHLGRRILLVSNDAFRDHTSASYDLMMGSEQPREAKSERLSQDEFSDFVKRNSSAFVAEQPEESDLEDLEEEGYDVVDDEDSTSSKSKEAQTPIELESDAVVDKADESNVEVLPAADASKLSEPEENVDELQGDVWARTFIWADTECVLARFEGTVVTLQRVFVGNFLLTTHHVYFRVAEGVDVFSKETIPISDDMRFFRYKLGKLAEIHGRGYLLKPQALELFFVDHKEVFLSFASHKERNRFYAKIRNSCKTPLLSPSASLNPRLVFKRSKLTSLWKKRQISNFDYLMALNRMAGRTFNDIAQYPVFPWILADYDSDKIDLSDTRVYRDLSKPVGALNPERLALLLERFNELESFGFLPEEKFLYGSHYSSPGMVVHFNIRQEPFTTMAISLQGGRFDCPDRLFFDMGESWKSCNTSTSDVKELIPEFFTMPEILLNQNKLPLGKTQRGIEVDDVGLPPWATGSAYEFVRIHRLALESEYVSRNLHNWIDLIFGFKQRGPEAEAAHNVFHHLSYEGSVDIDKIADELDRQAAESHIQNFGQTPSQLLNTNHPPRLGPEECWQPLINNMSNAVRLRCHTPAQSQQFGKKGTYTSGFVASIFIGGDGLVAVYSDLKVGFFKWSPKSPSNRLRPERLKMLQHREGSRSNSVIKRGNAILPGNDSEHTVGNWSFAVTRGGSEIANRRRKVLQPSRLASAKEALSTESSPLIVSCGYWDNTLKVHSCDDGSNVESTKGHRGEITCLAIGSCDGGFLVTGGDDCTCRVWTVAYPDMAVALSDGYAQTALGRKTSDDQILSCLHVLFGHEAPICCIDLSSELDVVASGSIDGTICIHKLRTGEFVRSFRSSNKPHVSVRKIVLEKHGRMVIFTSDLRLSTFSVNGVRLSTANAGERVHDMKITGEVVITGGENSHVYIRNLSTLKVLSGLDLSRHGPIRCLAMTPDSLNPLPQHLFIGSDDGMISIVEHD